MHKNNFSTDILILGAGIGGYETFRTLSKLLKHYNLPQKITIVDQNNYFTFTPMLHEVASGSIEPSHCTVPLRELVYQTPHQFIKARVQKIEPDKQRVVTDNGTIAYSNLVIGLGSGTNFFNTPGAAENSYTVRTLNAAMRLRHDVVAAFETTKEPITITVVGGGYTGIETVSQLLQLVRDDLSKLFPEVSVQLRVIEAGPTILSNLPQKVQIKIKERLANQGVEFIFNRPVKSVGKKNIVFADNQELASMFTIWCAGVKNEADSYLPNTHQEKGRSVVNDFLQSAIDPKIYVAGDMALFRNSGTDRPIPQLGEVAHVEGRYIAKHIIATLRGKKVAPFRFTSHGMLIPVGDWYGVLIVGNFILFGRIAWWIRRTAYLLFMPGFIRKLKILIDWTLHALSFRYIINIDH